MTASIRPVLQSHPLKYGLDVECAVYFCGQAIQCLFPMLLPVRKKRSGREFAETARCSYEFTAKGILVKESV